jgi:hypothetical protein
LPPAREDHVATTIEPALARGQWVISDRFADSTRVYQGALGQVDARMIRRLEKLTIGDTRPELTFILDLPAEEGLARAGARRGQANPDRFESETLEFHQKLRDAYRQLAAEEPERCVLIDASLPQDAVNKAIWEEVNARLEPATAPLFVEGGDDMSEADTGDRDVAGDAPHPRETSAFFGHADAEAAMLDSYRGGRVPHAWLIGGVTGIGKATLAYRFARFALAHPDPTAGTVQAARSLALDADHPIARRVAAQGHPDLLVLERTLGDTGKLRSVITVDQVRKTVPFFGSTAGEGGWRIVIVDTVDELNAEGENALLKLLEEPPVKSMLLLVTHRPGHVRATLRSRCRRLSLRPLGADDVARAAAAALGTTDAQLRVAARGRGWKRRPRHRFAGR